MVNEVGNGSATAKESVLDGVRNYLPPFPLDIEAAIRQIEANWSQGKSRSTQNWRLLHVPLKMGSNYEKRDWRTSEVLLERIICDKCRKQKLSIWNQMPTASGLLPLPPKRDDGKRRVTSEGRRAIDLVYRPASAEDIYEFLELKIRRKNDSADSLQHATLEVLEYGLLYLFSRKNQVELGYSKSPDKNRYVVLGASEIRLRVLAALDYYSPQDRSDVSVEAINKALETYIANNRTSFGNLKMNLGFQVLGPATKPYEAFIGKSEWQPSEA